MPFVAMVKPLDAAEPESHDDSTSRNGSVEPDIDLVCFGCSTVSFLLRSVPVVGVLSFK